jgi:hypothetical protein
MQPPGELRGSHRLVGWLNKLLWFGMANRLVEGVGYRLSRTWRGTSLEIATGGGSGSSLKAYQIVSIENDFYSCLAWTGSATTGDEVYIARPFEHMVSNWNGRSIAYDSDGDAFTATYSYTSTTKRTKTVGAVAETQVLVPYFKTGLHIIYAMKVSGLITAGAAFTPVTDPNDAPITLIDLNLDGRAWAKLE